MAPRHTLRRNAHHLKFVAASEVHEALDGEAALRNALTVTILPVVKSRVARTLEHFGHNRRVTLGLEPPDLVQEAMAQLYYRDAQLLRAWHPERGLSFLNWVGMLTQRLLIRQLKKSKKTRQEAESACVLDEQSMLSCPVIERGELTALLAALETRVSERSFTILVRTCLDEDAATIAKHLAMTEQAAYAARRRITIVARKLCSHA